MLETKNKNTLIAKATAAIESDFGSDKTTADVATKAGYKVIAVGSMGRHKLMAPDGSDLTPKMVTRDEALALLEQMVDSDEEVVMLDGSNGEKPKAKAEGKGK